MESRNTLGFQQKQLNWWVILKQARISAAEWTTCGTVQVDTHVSQEHLRDNT